VARVPWARHGSRFTREFEQQVAWLASQCSKSAVCELMRVSWYTVGRVIERVVADMETAQGDRLEGLRRIGIDELSYRTGQRYITVVVDHETGRLVWAAAGRDKQTVASFFDLLGEERCALLELVSSDLGEWITRAVAEKCPQAVLCLDPFHVVKLASDALDEVRREVWNLARKAGDKAGARWLKGARWALWKRPERLTDRPAAGEAVADREDQRAALPRLPAERAVAARLPRTRHGCRCRVAGRLARLGTPLPDRELRQARQNHQHEPRRDRRDPHVSALERPGRSDQHHPAADHPARLRLPLRRSADRARDAHRRRPPATATRPCIEPTETSGAPQ